MLAWLASSKVISEWHEQKYETDTRGEKSRLALRFCRCHAAADIFYHPTCVRAWQALNSTSSCSIAIFRLEDRSTPDSRSSLFWSRVTLQHLTTFAKASHAHVFNRTSAFALVPVFLFLATQTVCGIATALSVLWCATTPRRPRHGTCVSDRSSIAFLHGDTACSTYSTAQHSTAHPHRASRAARLHH
jgi:hypothetical protein